LAQYVKGKKGKAPLLPAQKRRGEKKKTTKLSLEGKKKKPGAFILGRKEKGKKVWEHRGERKGREKRK